LNAGELNFVSLNASRGIVFVAPLFSDYYLFVMTGAESQAGLINIARFKVKKELRKLLKV
jgi:hypothetical protein